MESFIQLVEQQLLPSLNIESVSPFDPIVPRYIPEPWEFLGVGNYAAVVTHPNYPDLVVKVYAPGRPGIKEETDVYRKLGSHPAYSECYHYGESYLILKRLRGVTLFDCIQRKIRIPEQVILDIDQALHYAKQRGLHPHDVHGKNVMLYNGRGLVVDISDFYKEEHCTKWEDLKKAYYTIYLPFIYRFNLPIPLKLLNAVRKCYRYYRKMFKTQI